MIKPSFLGNVYIIFSYIVNFFIIKFVFMPWVHYEHPWTELRGMGLFLFILSPITLPFELSIMLLSWIGPIADSIFYPY